MNRTIGLGVVGLIAGILGGALGMSAATVIVPCILILGLVQSYKTAIGTAILTILPPLSILALVKYYKEGLVDVQAALILMLSVALGTGVGAHITIHHASESALAYTSASIYGAAALVWMWVARSNLIRS